MLIVLLFVPVLVFAAATTDICKDVPGFQGIICRLQRILNSLIPLLITLGVVYMVWGIVQYFIGDSEEAKKKGRDRIIFGIIGLAVIISLWGLVYMVSDTFKLGGYEAPKRNELNNLLPN